MLCHLKPRQSLLRHLLLFALVALAGVARAADPQNAKEAGPDFAIQGEYLGDVVSTNGQSAVGVQVIALGDGKFRAVGHIGGLPGDGWDGTPKKMADGKLKDGTVTFGGDEYSATLKDGKLTITGPGGLKLGELKKVERTSPTLGAKPLAGAVVLFDGPSTNEFADSKVTEDGLLVQGPTSKPKFQSGTLHIEFRTPFIPDGRDQGRGNSGCYLQGRYEVQVLDSFGLEGKNNECGGIYSIEDSKYNMCYPPLTWQTYDIDFTAAKFDGDKKVADATMTVRHNGVVVHKDTKLTHATTAAPNPEGPTPGPIYLQDHGSPVRYRNIWFSEKK